jgi:hypothetical protein
MLDIDKAIFDENLLLTQAYCEQQLKNTYKNYASILRSFNPIYNDREIFSFKLEHGTFNEDVEYCFLAEWSLDPLLKENNFLYNDLFEKQMNYKKRVINTVDPTGHKGKILIATIDYTVLDGASEAVSYGLVDFNDCPPIDTWFYITKDENSRVLFAWIPEPFEKLADRGIDVNPVDCLNWYTKQRLDNTNWHAENLDDVPKVATHKEEGPQSIFSQIKKMFS